MPVRKVICIKVIFTTLLFGFFLINIDVVQAATEGENAKLTRSPTQVEVNETADGKEADDGLWVEVEPSQLLPSDITGIYYLVPYRYRRDKWSHTVSVGYSSFDPINYEPNFVTANFDEVYNAAADLPLMELQYSMKRNMVIGSIGLEIGAGFYKNSADSDLVASDLQVIPVRVGLNLSLDNLYYEPYVVPYGFVGAYTIFYDESVEGSSFGGNTQAAAYFGGGLAFQLNWLDRESARISYLDSGVENTFIYVEARQFFASQAAADPDFSTAFNWGAGVRLEF